MKFTSLFLLLLCSLTAFAQQEPADKTLSPYFMVKGAAKGVDALPLKNTSAKVNIAGVIADVAVTQTYVNTGTQTLECVYVFPGSTQAAVYGLTMRIGQRTVKAKIAEREKARAQYEQAKREGKRASLLEQQRPNVFQMNVANITPGDTIEVELRYTELLVPENGEYRFVYPTVVGPRYTNGKSGNNYGSTAQPYQHKGDAPFYASELYVHLAAGMPVLDVQSPSHRIDVDYKTDADADVRLHQTETKGGNRDFILKYSLRGEQVDAGLLLYDDGDEKFFLCMAQPPKSVAKADIPAREYIFVVDVSGSMNGFPLDVSKKLLKNLVGGLRSNDQFNVILFAGTSNILADKSLKANSGNLQKAFDFLDKQEGSGGTELLPALERALKLPRAKKGLSRSIVVVTDGYIDVEAECFNLVRRNLNKANLFAFGIGSSVNRHLIEGLAHVGGGLPFVVLNEKEAGPIAEQFRQYIATPVMSEITVSFPGFDAYDIVPDVVPDVFSQRPVIVMGKWRGNVGGDILIQGHVGNKAHVIRVPVNKAQPDIRNAAIRAIWARERIKYLMDYNAFGKDEKRDKAVTQLGLKYSLLTAFTSFIAIDEVVAANGKPVQVKQPLPMPQGVSNLAIGFDLSIRGMSGFKRKPDGTAGVVFGSFLALLLAVYLLRRFKSQWVLFIAGATMLGSCAQEPAPVAFVQGDSVAFMLGSDRSDRNPYFTIAEDYFAHSEAEQTDLQVSSCKTLREVHEYLAEHRPMTGPWRCIRLVVHGNAWTGMRVAVDGPMRDRTDADLLQDAMTEGLFPALPEGHVDSATQLIVDGCNLGHDKALLAMLSQAFDGASVHSARYFNIFERTDVGVKRYLADYSYVVFPNGTFPGNPAVARELATRYANDTTDWHEALQRIEPRFSGDSYVHYFVVPVEWIVLYDPSAALPKPQTEAEKQTWVASQPELMTCLDTMGLLPSHFQWTIKQTTFEGQPALTADGLAKVYCVIQPLKDADGLLNPAVEDERYYSVVQ
jgi:hypothetical protein